MALHPTFGLIVKRVVFFPSFVCERAMVLRMTVLPPPVCPTTIVVCRVITVSYSWMTLSTWQYRQNEEFCSAF